MIKPPSFPFYTNNWIASAQILAMSPAEEGAYIRLLCYAWNSEDCGLPDDDRVLAEMSRLREQWVNGSSGVIKRCFIKKNGRLFSPRLMECRADQERWREKCSRAGQASARQRLKPRNASSTNVQQAFNSESDSESDSYLESEKKKICPPKGGRCEYPESFEEFWSIYPRKEAKKDAFKAWKKAKTMPDLEKTKVLIDQFKKSDRWTKDGGQFIPLPATWINGERWNDDLQPILSRSATSSAPSRPTPRQAYDAALKDAATRFMQVMDTNGTQDDINRCHDALRDKYRDTLVFIDNGQRRILLTEAMQIARRKAGSGHQHDSQAAQDAQKQP